MQMHRRKKKLKGLSLSKNCTSTTIPVLFKSSVDQEVRTNDIECEEDADICMPTQLADYHPLKSVPDDISCPTCGKSIALGYSERERHEHVNACLDAEVKAVDPVIVIDDQSEEENQEIRETPPASSKPDDSSCCNLCGESIAHLEKLVDKIKHIKKCGKKLGIRAQELVVVQPNESSEMSATPEKKAASYFDLLMANAAKQRAEPKRQAKEHETKVPQNSFDILMANAVHQQPTRKTKRSFAPATTTHEKTEKSRKPARCPEFKKIQGTQPPVIVDGFQYASPHLSSIYVLTHFHYDHYIGLSKKSFVNCGKIYCSEITGRLLHVQLGLPLSLLVLIPYNQTFQLTPVIEMTLVDANHCPGAALVLFHLLSLGQYVLHTGDFRYHRADMTTHRTLARFCHPGPKVQLHRVYLDTTYCDAKYVFPAQAQVIADMIERIQCLTSGASSSVKTSSMLSYFGMTNKPRQPRTLFLFGTYSIGKERVFLQVAQTLGCTLVVTKAKLKMLKCFQWWSESRMHALFTTDPFGSDFHVVPMNHLRFDRMSELLSQRKARYDRIVAFRPTGWTFTRSPKSKTNTTSLLSKQSSAQESLIIYGMPYSEHSSFTELCSFLSDFQPQEIIPTVNVQSTEAQLALLRRSAKET